jgi:hypothetical protein
LLHRFLIEGKPRSIFLSVSTTGEVALIWAGGGVDREVEELVLKVFGGGEAGLTAGGGGDDGQKLKLGESRAGDVEALGVGAGVWGGEEEAIVVGQSVEKGVIRRGQTLQEVAGAEDEA